MNPLHYFNLYSIHLYKFLLIYLITSYCFIKSIIQTEQFDNNYKYLNPIYFVLGPLIATNNGTTKHIIEIKLPPNLQYHPVQNADKNDNIVQKYPETRLKKQFNDPVARNSWTYFNKSPQTKNSDKNNNYDLTYNSNYNCEGIYCDYYETNNNNIRRNSNENENDYNNNNNDYYYDNEFLDSTYTDAENYVRSRDDSGLVGPSSNFIPEHHHHLQTFDDYFKLFAGLLGKLILGTMLSFVFVIFGNILYQFAELTGTTAIFGQDSVIGYIYKGLPIVDALIKGEFSSALTLLSFFAFLD